jgi:hypothetical protein
MSEMLNYVITNDEIEDCFVYKKEKQHQTYNNNKNYNNIKNYNNNDNDNKIINNNEETIDFSTFAEWWNSERLNPGLLELKANNMATFQNIVGPGTVFG